MFKYFFTRPTTVDYTPQYPPNTTDSAPDSHSLQWYMNNGAYANVRHGPDPPRSEYPNPEYAEYEERLKELYSKFSYLNDKDFIKTAQHQVNPNIPPPPTEAIREFLARQPGRQVVDFRYRHDNPFTTIKKPGFFQIDIVFFLQQLYHLYIIEMNSRKVWVIPVHHKNGEDSLEAFKAWYYKHDYDDYIHNDDPNPPIILKEE